MIGTLAFLEYLALGISLAGCVWAVVMMRTDKPGKPKDRARKRRRQGW